MKVKSNSITLELIKSKTKHWDDLKEKKSALGQTPSASSKEKEDPSSSLMNMMKELYENGDDQMKRTIAESWQKSQQEKGMKK